MEGTSTDSSSGVISNTNYIYYNDPETFLEHSLHNLHKDLLNVLDEDCVCYCDDCWKDTSKAPEPTPSVSLSLSHSSYSVVTDNENKETNKQEVEDKHKEGGEDETENKKEVKFIQREAKVIPSYPNIGHWLLEASVVNRIYPIQERFVEANIPSEISRSWVDIKNIWNDSKVGRGWNDVESEIEDRNGDGSSDL